jgi:alkylation response protein AidB-like acyl-CoA dehydrogenase
MRSDSITFYYYYYLYTEYVVERMWRDAKLLEIGGGTNESHHKNMIREFKRCPLPID